MSSFFQNMVYGYLSDIYVWRMDLGVTEEKNVVYENIKNIHVFAKHP